MELRPVENLPEPVVGHSACTVSFGDAVEDPVALLPRRGPADPAISCQTGDEALPRTDQGVKRKANQAKELSQARGLVYPSLLLRQALTRGLADGVATQHLDLLLSPKLWTLVEVRTTSTGRDLGLAAVFTKVDLDGPLLTRRQSAA